MAKSVLNILVNSKGKGRLALNFLNQIRKFWRPVEHLNESLSPNNQLDEVEHKVSGKLESPTSDAIIYRNTNGIFELKQLRNQNPHRIIIGQLNINSIGNKFESLVRFVGNNLNILMVPLRVFQNRLDSAVQPRVGEFCSISERIYLVDT